LGPVIIAYAFGLILGNSNILPQMGGFLNEYILLHPKASLAEIESLLGSGQIEEKHLLAFKIHGLKDNLMSISVLLAIPLMLFSSNIKQWKNLAGKTLASLFIGLFSVISLISLGYFIFHSSGIPDFWKISGLLVGVYTGGTPNLASLKMMLDVDPNTYILTHTYDLIIGVFYLSFLVSIGKKLFNKFLPPYPKSISPSEGLLKNQEGELQTGKKIKFISRGLGYALSIVALGVSLGSLVPENMLMVVTILTITSLAILASTLKFVNRAPLTFDTGMYFILIFSIVVASMADVRSLTDFNPVLLAYISLAVFGSLLLHLLLSRIFKIDADTTMITSVSFICSPPFVPVIAGALGNKNIIISGITIGIVGYAIGNYLGFFMANFLKFF
jgi:uncharacterized membrane protein